MDYEEAAKMIALESFMETVAEIVGCLPSYSDPHPERGNAHIIKQLRLRGMFPPLISTLGGFMKLKLNNVEIDRFTETDWKDLYFTLLKFSDRVADRHGAAPHQAVEADGEKTDTERCDECNYPFPHHSVWCSRR